MNCYAGDVLADDIVFMIPGAYVEALFVADPFIPNHEIQSKSLSLSRCKTLAARQRRSEMDRPGKNSICETYK